MNENRPDRYYGKYRATVVNNKDPEQRGRIQAIVPDVQGLVPTTWALPCVPMAGKQQGTFMVPQIGAAVWIEFEQGDPDYPIWVGGFWGVVAEVPTAAFVPSPTGAGEPLSAGAGQAIVFQTTGQHSLIISDAKAKEMPVPVPAPFPPGTGGIILRSPSGAMIVVNDEGIYIHNGKGASIELNGPKVEINKVALVVT